MWARDLTDAGYRVLGIDISEAMIEISRRRVPEAEFQGGSLFDADIPRAVRALVPSGVFVFDVLGPGQVPPGAAARGFRAGDDWAVLSEREEDTERGLWRAASSASGRWGTTTGGTTRSTACGCTIYDTSELSAGLGQVGFDVRMMRSYGNYLLAEGNAAFVARKPA